jgi:hypothetical protein
VTWKRCVVMHERFAVESQRTRRAMRDEYRKRTPSVLRSTLADRCHVSLERSGPVVLFHAGHRSCQHRAEPVGQRIGFHVGYPAKGRPSAACVEDLHRCGV